MRNLHRLLGQSKKPYFRSVQQPSRAATTSPLSNDQQTNVETLRKIYSNSVDVVFRSFLIGGKTQATLIYIEGLSDTEEINTNLLRPLMEEFEEGLSLRQLFEKKVNISKIDALSTYEDCVEALSVGKPVLFHEGDSSGYALGLNRWDKRAIEEPEAEAGIRGPREGFTETISVSTAQLRRIIKSPALKIEPVKIGSYTQTQVLISYVEGIVDKNILEEVRTRLSRIEIDGVLESSYVEEMIEDNPFSPFPQVKTTERPDTACNAILEGRVAILTEGTPFVLIVPTTLFSLLQSQEDYYQRFLISTLIRWLRYTFVTLSMLLPSLYVAILTFHLEMVPTSLLITMSASRESVPFPALVEALLMEVTFEVLREAGVRLPKQVGAAVSIVGALVIGQAAVQAGIVSAPMVIVVAITGIASFMVPRYNIGIAFRILRFPVMFLAGALGLLGIMLGLIAILIHLCNLRSFGIPYLSPIAPFRSADLKDVAMRAPWWMMNTRPHQTEEEFNQYRQAPAQKPGPDRNK
ncbi:spore germination protein [Paenibacillus sp. HJL G12]|uniref:Spore germination protein n=1 Tax=Paenibacillus dendrobii TaxID=2691084 RepID=A0A7X3ILN8_9BACL|nr:spore germination protein [Paenibacillus dendrobii]MWV45691.1 spore germination protein [Paenibacillus dendrobii]